MIPRYSDHAANERTFLAWIRTALAMVAFGAVLAKFNLFLRLTVAQNLSESGNTHQATAVLGITFVTLGIALFLLSYRRFCRTRKEIRDETLHTPERPVMELITTIALAGLGITVLIALIKELSF